MPTPNAGDDALLFSVGLSVPIWQSAHERASQASQADARAERASRQAALDAAQSQLETALSRLSETHRRAVLYRGSMLPQAEAAYHSVMGAYTAGRGSVVAMLLAQRELLELSLGLQRVLADHARAWVALERIVGRRVARGDLVEASL